MIQGKTVLIVDDDALHRSLLVAGFSKLGGILPLEASDGAHCMDILGARAVDLVLMDIMMPGRLGTQVLQEIRQKFSPIDLPIVMVSSKSDTVDLIEAFRLGANDYISKPVDFPLALARMETHLKLADLSKELMALGEGRVFRETLLRYSSETNGSIGLAIDCLNSKVWSDGDKALVETVRGALGKIQKLNESILEMYGGSRRPDEPVGASRAGG